jgi:hypothetical protein
MSTLNLLRRGPRWLWLTWALVAWVLLTTALLAYEVRSAMAAVDCTGAELVAFCRSHALDSALAATRGPLMAYGVGTLCLGAAWLWAVAERPACPECGSRRRSDLGVCRRCGFDPFGPDNSRLPDGKALTV